MERYNYKKALYDDILSYIRENIDYDDFDSLADLHDYLYETLWTEDNVTGNGSLSYTYSRWEAEENIAHNLDLVYEVIKEWGLDLENGISAEAIDVSIRCLLLDDVITEVIEDIEDEFYDSLDDRREREKIYA